MSKTVILFKFIFTREWEKSKAIWAEFTEKFYLMELELLSINDKSLPQSYIDDL